MVSPSRVHDLILAGGAGRVLADVVVGVFIDEAAKLVGGILLRRAFRRFRRSGSILVAAFGLLGLIVVTALGIVVIGKFLNGPTGPFLPENRQPPGCPRPDPRVRGEGRLDWAGTRGRGVCLGLRRAPVTAGRWPGHQAGG